MHLSLNILLLFLAFVCFLVQFILTLAGGSSGKINLPALGMCFFVAAFLFG